MITPVFIKPDLVTSNFTVSLASDLGLGESITAVSFVSLSPVTAPVLTATFQVLTPTPTDFVFQAAAGLDKVGYGVKFNVTTDLPRTFPVVVALQVLTDLNVPYATRNPYAFQPLIGELPAGEAALGKGIFILPSGTNTVGGQVNWEIYDSTGVLLSSGNSFSYQTTSTSFTTVVEAEAVVNLPSGVAATLETQSYQLRWTLDLLGIKHYASESLRVPSSTGSVPLGTYDLVELQGDDSSLQLTLSKAYDSVGYQIFKGNLSVQALTPVINPVRVASGYTYTASIATTSYVASLEPYQVSWRYLNLAAPSSVFRESCKLFLLTPSMMSAVEDVRMQVMKARTTLLGFQDTLFDTPTIVSWLLRGRDYFNAAGGAITLFDMTDARGPIREFWLRYSEVAMLRAQSLAEGEKAFDFQGQAISLNVDHTQYYDKLAEALMGDLNNDVGTFKKNLKMIGITSGSGDTNAQTGYRSRVGISISPASSLTRTPIFRL